VSRTILLTGAAGFIGSHLSEKLLKENWVVYGVDSFTDYYGSGIKRLNLSGVIDHPRFKLYDCDIVTALPLLPRRFNAVIHLAGQPGVRGSWEHGFEDHITLNIRATQKLLEWARFCECDAFVNASSSSVYGNALSFPTKETILPSPVSPYGVSKLASERLASAYRMSFGLPCVSLRFFTVFGPRQRPDMAFSKLIDAALSGKSFHIYGDGTQSRDFTYVEDIVDGIVRALTWRIQVSTSTSAETVEPDVFNLGGLRSVQLNEVIYHLEQLLGVNVGIEHGLSAPGDPRITSADISMARDLLGWEPKVDIEAGLAKQVAWRVDHGRQVQ